MLLNDTILALICLLNDKNLADMPARFFSELEEVKSILIDIRQNMVTKADLEELKQGIIAVMVTKADLERYAQEIIPAFQQLLSKEKE